MNDACNRRPVHSIEFEAASSHMLTMLNKDQKYFFTNEIKEQNGMFTGICLHMCCAAVRTARAIYS